MNQPRKQYGYAINTKQMENFFQENIGIFLYVFIFFIAKMNIKQVSKSAYATKIIKWREENND